MGRVPTRASRLLVGTLGTVAVLASLAGCSGSSDDAGRATPSRSPSPSAPPPSTATPSASSSAPSPSATSPTATASPTASATTGATPGAALPTVRREATTLHVAQLESSVARTPEEKAVVRAWMRYWRAATDSTYLGREVDDLAEVSAGQARSSIQGLLRQNKAVGQRGVGWSKDNVTKVSVSGDTATVRDCTRNFTFNVDEEGTPVTKPFPWYDVSGRLEQRDGAWVVVSQSSPGRASSCLAD